MQKTITANNGADFDMKVNAEEKNLTDQGFNVFASQSHVVRTPEGLVFCACLIYKKGYSK